MLCLIFSKESHFLYFKETFFLHVHFLLKQKTILWYKLFHFPSFPFTFSTAVVFLLDDFQKPKVLEQLVTQISNDFLQFNAFDILSAVSNSRSMLACVCFFLFSFPLNWKCCFSIYLIVSTVFFSLSYMYFMKYDTG